MVVVVAVVAEGAAAVLSGYGSGMIRGCDVASCKTELKKERWWWQ